jgi:hypothetical protein
MVGRILNRGDCRASLASSCASALAEPFGKIRETSKRNYSGTSDQSDMSDQSKPGIWSPLLNFISNAGPI